MNKNLNNIIKESVRRVLLEMDIVPTDDQGNANLVQNQAMNAWKMIYSFMDNVKTSMDATMQGKKKYDHYNRYTSSSTITNQDIDNIIDYSFFSPKKWENKNVGRKTNSNGNTIYELYSITKKI